MTNREDLPETVAVPVELLKRVQGDGVTSPATNELLALIPKPKPRLVAVTSEQWYGDSLTDTEFASLPDLLTLLDDAIAIYPGDVHIAHREGLKLAIRAALGVDQ